MATAYTPPPAEPVDLGYTSLEITTTGVTKTLGPDGWTVRDDNGRYVDPVQAQHEINPDGFHETLGIAASNCPYCHDGAR